MKKEAFEEIKDISGEEKAQAERLLDKIKINSLCDLVDDYESECAELQSSQLNNVPMEKKMEEVKSKFEAVKADEEVRRNELRNKDIALF